MFLHRLFPVELLRGSSVTFSHIIIPIYRQSIRAMSTTTSPTDAKDINAAPAVDQHILHHGKEYTTIKEGLAYILVPAETGVPQTSPQGGNQPQSVFYNPIQQFNRDLSVLAIKAYGEELVERKKADIERRKKNAALNKSKKRKREGEGGASNGAEKVVKMNSGDKTEGSAEPITTENEEDKLTSKPAQEAVPGPQDVKMATEETASIQPAKSTTEAPQNGDSAPNLRQPTFTILDALSATGLRALRYSHEIPFTTSVTANDLLPEATKTINLNVKHNKLEDKIVSITGNAMTHMYSLAGEETNRFKPSKKYDVIDLDPYGTAAPFLDAAVQAVQEDGGLLAVTCTDAGVWASNGYPEKAYSLYGGLPLKGQHSHEAGLRLILHSIAQSAARYGLAIEPLLSLSIDFYARVFVRVHKSAADVKFLAGKTMIVYNCDQGCGAWSTQLLARNKVTPNKNGKGTFYKHVFSQAPSQGQTCEHCGTKMHLAGPMYAGPLHKPEFIKRILEALPGVDKDIYHTTTRIEGMLTTALEETLPAPPEPSGLTPPPHAKGRADPAALDHFPFFFQPSTIAKVIHCITPHENAIKGALRGLGYRVTRSHTKSGTIKTDAPWSVIWEIMREWARQKCPIREGAIRDGTPGWRIMGYDKKKSEDATNGDGNGEGKQTDGDGEKLKIVFDEQLGRDRDAKKIVRYQINPRENWGPMNRAKGPA
jgi:tRNA (guanine26-N2/guanine27-N2)-dimethyltransferase